MNAQVIPNTIMVKDFGCVDIDSYLEWYATTYNEFNNYDGYCKAPKAIYYNGYKLGKSGYNTDTGVIYYNTRSYRNSIAHII